VGSRSVIVQTPWRFGRMLFKGANEELSDSTQERKKDDKADNP